MIEHPSIRQIEVALDVLLWLHAQARSLELQGSIALVRRVLDDEIHRAE